MADSDTQSGDADSNRGLWHTLRRFFDADDGTRSLREQLEDAIDEHTAAQGDARDDAPTNGDLSPVERQMLKNLLHFSEHDADDVAIPRGEIVALNASASWDEVVEAFAEHGHSRLLVYRETLDEVIGMMHIKDIFPIIARKQPPPTDWTSLLRQPLYVPQARTALDVLADMRQQRIHLAVVLDEYSGTDGIITIEDLVEEIVGDIEDEHDDEAEEWIIPLSGGMWDCDARAELDDVAERIDPRLAEVEESVDTLGGLAFVLAETVPEVGAIVTHPSGWRMEVTDADETHVKRLRLHPPETTPETDD
jgi:CBS domain containing-hemolysin-like protein